MLNPLKAFKHYIVGDALAQAKNEFETAGINLLINYGIIGYLVSAVFTVYLFYLGANFFAVINAVILLLMIPVFVVFKKTRNVKTAGKIYVIMQLAASTLWGFALNFSVAPEEILWLVLNVLIAFFILGNTWGYGIAAFATLHLCFGFVNLHSGMKYLNNYFGALPPSNLVSLLIPIALNIYVLREFVRTRNVAEAQIRKSKDEIEKLLLNILPAETAEELRITGTTKAKDFSEVTVMFTDFKNFTMMSERLSAQELVNEINYCYSAFDNIITKYGVEKIKTIGDAYMCAGGLPVPNKTNAEDVVRAALEIKNFMLDEKQKREEGESPFFEIRIGCNTGPVVAGIVGIKKFAYDIWGDTVNIAARMEQNSEAGKINVSGATYELVKDKFNCTHRGKIQAKNKGEVDMYFVDAKT